MKVKVDEDICIGASACEAVVQAQEETGKFVAVDFNRRFAPAYLRAKELAWAAGGPYTIYYRISDPYVHGWGRKFPPGVRVIHEVCHVFDLLRWLTEDDVATIYTAKARDDDEVYVLRFTSGRVATILNSGYATRDLPKEYLEFITEAGGVSVQEFVELRAFGYPGVAPVERFAGHSHPDHEYTHRPLFEKVGAEALFALRRSAWDILQEEGTGSLTGRPDASEREEFLRSGQMWNYMVDKGWLSAIDHFAECVATGNTPGNAGARDGLQASILSHAAIRSRESGDVVKL